MFQIFIFHCSSLFYFLFLILLFIHKNNYYFCAKWAYHTIPFGFNMFWDYCCITFQPSIILYLVGIDDNGLMPGTSSWPILYIKWCNPLRFVCIRSEIADRRPTYLGIKYYPYYT